jgi:hypothetical protein
MYKLRSATPLSLSITFGAAAALLVLMHGADVLGPRPAFLLLTGVLVAYLFMQVMHLRSAHPHRWLLNPIVICTAMTFVLGFGIGNLLFFLAPETLDLLGMVPDVTPTLFKMMALVMLAAVAMWQGYWSRLASNFSRSKTRDRFAGLLRKSNQLRPFMVPLLVAISVAAKLMQINLGIFGYSGTYENFSEAGSYTQYLALFSSLGKVALVAATLNFYMARSKDRGQLLMVLSEEVIFGILSGFKSQIALPFVIVGFCQYLVTGKLPKRWLVAVAVGIFLAYQVVEPFRALRNEQESFRGTSVTEIAAAMVGARATEIRQSATEDGKAAALLSFLARSSYVYVGSVGIDYKDHVEVLPEGSPEFLTNIFLAPAHAWIPRAIWKDKPVGDLGMWYTREVFGRPDASSSTSMTMVTYLYFAGGVIAVYFGFFFIGFMQRTWFFCLQPTVYAGGALVYLGIVQALAIPPDSFSDLLIILLRELPLLLLVQAFVIRPQRKRAPSWEARTAPSHLSGRG